MPKVIENLKEKILEEADRQLREAGYSAMTIQSIARACGVGVGTVYNYFSSKDEILLACVAEAWSDCMETIRAVAKYSSTCKALIHCIYDQVYTFGMEHEYYFRDAAAANSIDGAIYRYLGCLSSQLAEPLRKYCKNDSEAQLIAEALLIWIRTGKSYEEICASIMKLF